MALARQLIGGTLADVPRPLGDGTPEDEGSDEVEEEAVVMRRRRKKTQ